MTATAPSVAATPRRTTAPHFWTNADQSLRWASGGVRSQETGSSCKGGDADVHRQGRVRQGLRFIARQAQWRGALPSNCRANIAWGLLWRSIVRAAPRNSMYRRSHLIEPLAAFDMKPAFQQLLRLQITFVEK